MVILEHTFRLSLFAKKVQKFSKADMGLVIEKEPHVICVYGTNADHHGILCAIPLCPTKQLKGMDFKVCFHDSHIATVEVESFRVVIDFKHKTCSNNHGLVNYGSDSWGQNITAEWNNTLDALF